MGQMRQMGRMGTSYMAEDFAADAKHRIVEDAFLGGLADVARQADDEHGRALRLNPRVHFRRGRR